MKTLHVTMAVGFMLIYIQPKLLFFLKDLLQLLIANNNCKGGNKRSMFYYMYIQSFVIYDMVIKTHLLKDENE